MRRGGDGEGRGGACASQVEEGGAARDLLGSIYCRWKEVKV